MVGLILSKVYPITISITIHGLDEFNPTLPTGWCMAEKIKACNFVCAISKYGRSQLLRTCSNKEDWEKIEVSPLGVDPSEFLPQPFREWPAPFQVICVARLAPVKAQHVLIGALDDIVLQGRDVQLRLIGDGPDRLELEEEVIRRGLRGRVIFEGWLNQDRVRAAYREADLFVLPSFAEGVPVVLMEAMAMGIPCVATWVTGVPELIRNELDGLLVVPSDQEELATAIMRLMDDAALRCRLGQAGRQRVLEEYDLFRSTARLANIFYRRLGTTNPLVASGSVLNKLGEPVPPETTVIESAAMACPWNRRNR